MFAVGDERRESRRNWKERQKGMREEGRRMTDVEELTSWRIRTLNNVWAEAGDFYVSWSRIMIEDVGRREEKEKGKSKREGGIKLGRNNG